MITARDARAAAAARRRSGTSRRIRKTSRAPPAGSRQAARLPGQRGHEPEAPGRDPTRSSPTYSWRTRNVHRGVHLLSEKATQAYEEARSASALLTRRAREIVFVRGPRRASTWSPELRPYVDRGGRRGHISTIEHHSNIVPWQLLVRGSGGALLRVIPATTRRAAARQYARLLGARRSSWPSATSPTPSGPSTRPSDDRDGSTGGGSPC